MTVVALLAALGALRVIAAFVAANGVAALAVAGVAWLFTSSTDAAWTAELFQFSVGFAIVCLASAVASWRGMPIMTIGSISRGSLPNTAYAAPAARQHSVGCWYPCATPAIAFES